MSEVRKPQITINSHGEDMNLFEILSLCKKVLPSSTAEELRGRVYRSTNYVKAVGIVREYVNLIDENQIKMYERAKGRS